MEFVKWPKVRQIHNVRKDIKARKRYHEVEGLDPYQPPEILYRGKIKLDGTNAALRISGDEFATQSRNRLITPESDNCGFAAWVHSSGWVNQFDSKSTATLTIFGEWCGQGIQKRCAISKIDKKIFAVFGVLLGNPSETDDSCELIVDPVQIEAMLPAHDDVYVLPWMDSFTLDFSNDESLQSMFTLINEGIDKVEKCDPWVKAEFGIEGLGEGIVYYPVSRDRVTRGHLENWGFKAKGEEHQVVRQKMAVMLDPEKVASVDAFVEKFVTPNRLEQGLREACGEEADPKKTGDFLRWFGQDVKAESKDELDESGLEWKDVSKAVSTAARLWWLDKCKEV